MFAASALESSESASLAGAAPVSIATELASSTVSDAALLCTSGAGSLDGVGPLDVLCALDRQSATTTPSATMASTTMSTRVVVLGSLLDGTGSVVFTLELP